MVSYISLNIVLFLICYCEFKNNLLYLFEFKPLHEQFGNGQQLSIVFLHRSECYGKGVGDIETILLT